MSITHDVILRFSGNTGELEEAWCDVRYDGQLVSSFGGRGMVGPFSDVLEVTAHCLRAMQIWSNDHPYQESLPMD